MTTEIQARAENQIHRTEQWLLPLLKSPLSDQAERDRVADVIEQLAAPARSDELMARVAALLSPYYAGEVPQIARVIEANDWAEALGGFPFWAVERACRWWKGADNPNRRKRPLEGDIEARCRAEMGIVELARGAVRRFDNGVTLEVVTDRTPCDRETADRIVRDAGFAVRRFG